MKTQILSVEGLEKRISRKQVEEGNIKELKTGISSNSLDLRGNKLVNLKRDKLIRN